MRAVGAEFVERKLRQVLLLSGGVLVVSMLIAAWLANLSLWWLLVWVPLFFLLLLWGVLFVAGRFVLRLLRPDQTQVQTKAVSTFVDKMMGVAEQAQTPLPMIAFRIFWDVFVTKKRAYLQSVISDSASLRTDYAALRKQYENLG